MRVGVLGATGRMGLSSCRAVLGASDLELVAAVARGAAGTELRELVAEAPAGLRVRGAPEDLLDAKAEVVIDFSVPEATLAAARLLLPAGVHLVSGTTGLPAASMDELASLAGEQGAGNAVWAPNFALGAVLAQRFATIAARYYPAAEVIELHHAGKADAPSGTALATATRMAAASAQWAPDPTRTEVVPGARGGAGPAGIRLHSVRMRGMVAHQEVILGAEGQTLTLRQDSYDRSSYMPGVVLACATIADHPGVTVGLDAFLGL